MKKVFVMIFVLVLVLTACAKAPVATSEPTQIPMPETTSTSIEPTLVPIEKIDELVLEEWIYKNYSYVNSFVFLEIVDHESSLYKVTWNGETKTVIINTGMILNVADGRFPDGEVDFDEEIFTSEFFEKYKGVEFTAFFNFDYSLVLVPKCQMPKFASQEDPFNMMSWDKTKATVAVWTYPNRFRIVENIDTGEVAMMYALNAFDDESRNWIVNEGDMMWGWINVDSDYSINITESKPDPVKLEIAFALANESFPEQNFSGPSDACYTLNYSYNGGKLDKALVNDLCQMYYTKK